ncbi:MAG: hypothetical protein ABSG26_05460 [Bryobacteraceae bacterium]
MAAGAQNAACLVLRAVENLCAALRFDLQREAVALSAQLQVGSQRNHHEIVLVLAEDRSDALERPHHGELVGAGADHAADGIGVRKELLRHAIADQADGRGVAVFHLGEVAPQLDRSGVDVRHAGRVAVHGGVVELVVLVAQRRAAADGGAHHLALAAALGERLHVLGVKKAVAQRLGEDREIGDHKGYARNAKDVGAEVGDLLFDVEIGALDQRHHGDEGGDPHGQPEHRERGAQFVGADGVRRQRQVVGHANHVIE